MTVCVFDFQKKTAPTYDEDPSEQLKILEAIVMKKMHAETLGNYGVTSCNKTGTCFSCISDQNGNIYIFCHIKNLFCNFSLLWPLLQGLMDVSSLDRKTLSYST